MMSLARADWQNIRLHWRVHITDQVASGVTLKAGMCGGPSWPPTHHWPAARFCLSCDWLHVTFKRACGSRPPPTPVTTGLHMLLIGVCSSSLRAFHCLIMVETKLQKQMKGFLCATTAPCVISFSLQEFEWCKIVLQSQYEFFKVDIHNKLQYLFFFCLFVFLCFAATNNAKRKVNA